jgi:hypothetical protein
MKYICIQIEEKVGAVVAAIFEIDAIKFLTAIGMATIKRKRPTKGLRYFESVVFAQISPFHV